jgi:hypothetical protein
MTGRPLSILLDNELAMRLSHAAGELRQSDPETSDACYEAAIRLLSAPGPTADSIGYLVREELRRLGIDPDMMAAEAVDLALMVSRSRAAVLPFRKRSGA